jgi:hypothetical protein
MFFMSGILINPNWRDKAYAVEEAFEKQNRCQKQETRKRDIPTFRRLTLVRACSSVPPDSASSTIIAILEEDRPAGVAATEHGGRQAFHRLNSPTLARRIEFLIVARLAAAEGSIPCTDKARSVASS